MTEFRNIKTEQNYLETSGMDNSEKTARTPYRYSDQVGYLLRRAYQRHLGIFQTHCTDSHLTAVQFTALCALHDFGAQSQGELSKITGIDQATIRGVINRLRARELVILVKDSQDGRKVIIRITSAGDKLVHEMIPHAFQITELTLTKLNPAERLALLHTLRLLADIDSDPG